MWWRSGGPPRVSVIRWEKGIVTRRAANRPWLAVPGRLGTSRTGACCGASRQSWVPPSIGRPSPSSGAVVVTSVHRWSPDITRKERPPRGGEHFRGGLLSVSRPGPPGYAAWRGGDVDVRPGCPCSGDGVMRPPSVSVARHSPAGQARRLATVYGGCGVIPLGSLLKEVAIFSW